MKIRPRIGFKPLLHSLESRVVPSLVVASGQEFRVNTAVSGSQTNPTVALNSQGDSVVSFRDGDSPNYDVRVQKLNRNGALSGASFLANVTTTGRQGPSSAVAVDATGSFVMAWSSDESTGTGRDMMVRRFSPAGIPLTGEIIANQYTPDVQDSPAIAAWSDGKFVVVWKSIGQDGDGDGVFARVFGADGQAATNEIAINVTTANAQGGGQVVTQPDGSFVVVWRSIGQDGDADGVYLRRFNSLGVPLTGEMAVNSTTTGSQKLPAISADAGGNFVVAWDSVGQDGDGDGIFARLFAPNGTAVGGEFRVNGTTTNNQWAPRVASDTAGNFVVSWTQDILGVATSGDVYAQRFLAGGAP
ncbi:MAG: hypothetical protein K1X57_18350, partial [Gemmataceae bacterium]|nr:hypothetical protein [Gemmataceae bacterium]